MNTIYSSDPEVKRIALAAFPDYRGRSFQVQTFQGPMDLSSYWSDGSRNYYSVIHMDTLKAADIPQGGSGHGDVPHRVSILPPNVAVVEHTIYMGKDLGITIYVNQENLSKLLPSGGEELPWEEKVVLCATRSYKSSYAGVKDYRFREALKETGITKLEWDKAKESLIGKGMLNKAGAITDSGKNAIGRTDLRDLRKPDHDRFALNV
jgi:hypothetical protein